MAQLNTPKKAIRKRPGFERAKPSVWHFQDPRNMSKTICGIILPDPGTTLRFRTTWEPVLVSAIKDKKSFCQTCLGAMTVHQGDPMTPPPDSLRERAEKMAQIISDAEGFEDYTAAADLIEAQLRAVQQEAWEEAEQTADMVAGEFGKSADRALAQSFDREAASFQFRKLGASVVARKLRAQREESKE